MARPKRNRYSGVGVFANQWLLSRVQSLDASVDLSEEEIRELTNAEVVEYAAQTPSVSISVDTNEYGSMYNLRAICNVTGEDNIDVSTFDGAANDIAVIVEEDNIIKRTLHINEAYLSSLSYNFDVGGIATESFAWESDNKTWYLGDQRQAYAMASVPAEQFLTPPDSAQWGNNGVGTGWAYFDVSGCDIATTTGDIVLGFTPRAVYIDGVSVGENFELRIGTTAADHHLFLVRWAVATNDTTTSGTNYRVVLTKNTYDTTIPHNTDTSLIGGITRGMVDIYMNSGMTLDPVAGYGTEGSTNVLRLQSLSIDADLSREVLEEIGRYRAYDRSLTLPVPINLTFSANASDLTEWARFQGTDFETATTLGIDSFLKTASVQVRICDAKDTAITRNVTKTITISGIQVVSESFTVDAGSNATQDFTGKASNILISGNGIPTDCTGW